MFDLVKTKQIVSGAVCSCIPVRYMIAAVCFVALFLEYSVKSCMSVAIVAMVKIQPNEEESDTFNSSTVSVEDQNVCPGKVHTKSNSQVCLIHNLRKPQCNPIINFHF